MCLWVLTVGLLLYCFVTLHIAAVDVGKLKECESLVNVSSFYYFKLGGLIIYLVPCWDFVIIEMTAVT